jgi:hypothetical protein
MNSILFYGPLRVVIMMGICAISLGILLSKAQPELSDFAFLLVSIAVGHDSIQVWKHLKRGESL